MLTTKRVNRLSSYYQNFECDEDVEICFKDNQLLSGTISNYSYFEYWGYFLRCSLPSILIGVALITNTYNVTEIWGLVMRPLTAKHISEASS